MYSRLLRWERGLFLQADHLILLWRVVVPEEWIVRLTFCMRRSIAIWHCLASNTLTRQLRHYCEMSQSNTVRRHRSEEHTSELQSLMRHSYAVFCLKKNKI